MKPCHWCRLLIAGFFVCAGSISAFASESGEPDRKWLEGAPTLEQVLDTAPYLPEHHRDRLELAACLGVVEAVKVAARRDSSGGQDEHSVLGADFEHFLDRAESLRARANAYPEQTRPEQIEAFWGAMKDNPKGQSLRRAMIERLGGDEALARQCIALPALVDQLEFDDWKSGQKHQTTDTATENMRGAPTCGVSEPAAPVPFRYRPTMAWTGAELIYWGGSAASFDEPFYNTGFIYDYATDTWSVLTGTGDIPSPRRGAYGVASANEFIVYSGSATMGSLIPTMNTGGVLDLTTREWTATSTTDAPVHSGATAVWTGTEMILWGGSVDGELTQTGARYNPSTNQWTPMSTTNAPSVRSSHSAVWTGSEMVVFGGWVDFDTLLLSGARYNPLNNTWTAIRSANLDVPGATPRRGHTAVWTGTDMLVFGGTDVDFDKVAQGLRYNLAGNSWSAMNTFGQPTPRSDHTAVWTGSEMIIWAGIAEFTSGSTAIVRGGAAYNASANSWRTMPIDTGLNAGRADFFSAFTNDDEMLVFGSNFHSILHTGELYSAASNDWTAMSDQISQQSPGVLAYWNFDEFSTGQPMPDGTRVTDTCGDRDARVIAQPEVAEGLRPDLRMLEFESGNDDAVVFDPGYSFGDGGSDAGTEFDFASDESFTVEAVIRIPEGSTQVGSIVAKDVGPGQASWWFRVNNGVLQALIGDGDGNQPSVTGNTPVNDGRWHHVALVRDAINRTFRLYVDYKLDATEFDTTGGDISTPAGTNIVLGAFNAGTRQLQGDMELARVSRGRLAASEFSLADEVAGISVSITSSDFIEAGGDFSYQVVVSNAGPATATDVAVDVPLPTAFQSASWTCAPGSGATCAASGSDDISDTVDIPANRNVTYSIDAVVDPAHSGTETIHAEALLAAPLIDLNGDNNAASLTAVPTGIFGDRFEQP